MKVHTRIPEKEIVIVRPDAEHPEYELYLLYPVFLGHASRLGVRRIRLEDGRMVDNLELAAAAYLSAGKETEMVRRLAIDERFGKEATQQPGKVVRGSEIVEHGLWVKFKVMRRLGAVTAEVLRETYTLTADEARELGL